MVSVCGRGTGDICGIPAVEDAIEHKEECKYRIENGN
jgi:hypothetical protein